MNRFASLILPLVALVFCISACKNKNTIPGSPTNPSLNIPATYDTVGYFNNTQDPQAARLRMKEMGTVMKKGDTLANLLVLGDLLTAFQSGNPSLSGISTQDYVSNITGSTGWFQTMVTASQKTFNPLAPNTTGGVCVNRLVDKGGLEIQQLIDKGLYSAALLHQIHILLNQTTTVQDVDKMICWMGAHPSFPNTNTVANTNYPDAYLALYVARRDKADGNGYYSQLKSAFIKLKAAIQAGDSYTKERDEAKNVIRQTLEKALMATVVFYAYETIDEFSKTNLDSLDIADGLHDLSEAIGFTRGLYSIPSSDRQISNTTLENILDKFKAPVSGPSSLNLFASQPAQQLPRITEAITLIQQAYGFSNAELLDFKQNWIAVQGR